MFVHTKVTNKGGRCNDHYFIEITLDFNASLRGSNILLHPIQLLVNLLADTLVFQYRAQWERGSLQKIVNKSLITTTSIVKTWPPPIGLLANRANFKTGDVYMIKL